MWSRTSLRARFSSRSTRWSPVWARLGDCITQSGCSRHKSESGCAFSNSTQIPNFMPSLCTRVHQRLEPVGKPFRMRCPIAEFLLPPTVHDEQLNADVGGLLGNAGHRRLVRVSPKAVDGEPGVVDQRNRPVRLVGGASHGRADSGGTCGSSPQNRASYSLP